MRILFMGDIVVKDKGIVLSDEVRKIFDSCDIRVCNLEAPLINLVDKPIIKAGSNLFQTEQSILSIKNMGITLVSLANNHILDYGSTALSHTIATIQKEGINVIGAGFSFEETYKSHIVEDDNNKKIGFIACSQAEFGVFKCKEDSVGYAWVNHPQMNQIIKKVKHQVDYLYIIVHAGLEDIIYPLPEWRNRYKELIDFGADCIIGGHPHIIQGYEIYNGKYIYYSLGNFFFDSEKRNDVEWKRSIAVVNDTNDISKMQIVPCVVEEGTVKIDNTIETKLIIQNRSDILLNEKFYLKEIDNIAEELWEKYYRMYYDLCFYSSDINRFSSKKIIKYLIKRAMKEINSSLNKTSIDKTMLLHNIQIETHRWIVERYLYNYNKKQNNFDN